MPRVLNKDGIATKRHAEQREEAGVKEEVSRTLQSKVRVAIVNDRTIINGHVLPKGCVTEMSYEDVVNHRRHGVPLEDVDDNDEREVYDTSEPFVAKDENENGEQPKK